MRTPLNAIPGWPHLLIDGRLDDVSRKTAAQSILRSVQVQARLVDDLLAASRIVRGRLLLEPELIDLTGVLTAAMEQVRAAAAAKDIELLESLPASAALVGDAARLQQVTWNLRRAAAPLSD